MLYETQLGGWVNRAYSRLSTTQGHITDCKLDSVVYAGVETQLEHNMYDILTSIHVHSILCLQWTIRCILWVRKSTEEW